LFSMSTALIGSVDYYFVNQIINHLCGQLFWIGVFANVGKKVLQIFCLSFAVFNQIFKLDNLQKQREISKRPYQKILLVIGSALITFVVCVVIGFLMHIFLN